MIRRIMLLMGPDLPLSFHPAAIRVSAGSTPSGAGGATCDRRSCSGLRSRSHVAVRLGEIAERRMRALLVVAPLQRLSLGGRARALTLDPMIKSSK